MKEHSSYQVVGAGATDTLLGETANASVGQYLKRLVCVVDAAGAGSAASFKDGSGGSAVSIIPASAPVGTYVVDLDIRSKTAASPGFYITTGANVKVIAVGSFLKHN